MTKIRKILSAIAIFAVAAASAQIDLPSKVVGSKVVYYYEVPAKETIYSITRKFNVTRDELMRLNPSLIDGLRAGSTIIIAEVTNAPDPEEAPAEQPAVAEVAPEPVKEVQAEVVDPAPAPEGVEIEEPQPAEVVIKNVEPQVAAADNGDCINIAAILPFILDSEGITRNAQNQLNFYRGMLLAINDVASPDIKVNLTAVDSEGSNETIAAYVASPAFQQLDYVIAPGDSLAIETIAAAADTTGATVLNMFAVKNNAHQKHLSVLQANIPHAEMYETAIKGFLQNLGGKKVLLLNASDIPADKQAFTSQLTTQLVKNGIPWESIDYTGKLTAATLAELPARDYVFIPTASSREALLKILPALIEYKNANLASDIRLFGYPEWVVMRGDIKDNLHKLETLVYSRFSTDLDGSDVAAVNNAYLQWFGSEPAPSFPDTMLLGYDTMAWIYKFASSGIESPYRGLQNAFSIKEVPGGGDVNNALYLITFGANGRVNATTL